jgi:hypothetical protein
MDMQSKVSGAQEDSFTGMIEAKTSQIPSTAFLGAALGSMVVSAIFKSTGRYKTALFIGQWAAPFLLLGIYNKLVKQLGSDADSRQNGTPQAQAANA